MSNNDLDIEKWAAITIERWQNKIKQLKVYDTFELLNSFESHVEVSANGDPEKVVFTYLYYGLFPQLGVGRGVSLGEPSRRKKKPWYGGVLSREIKILAAKVAERYGDAASNAIRHFEKLNNN